MSGRCIAGLTAIEHMYIIGVSGPTVEAERNDGGRSSVRMTTAPFDVARLKWFAYDDAARTDKHQGCCRS